MAEPFKVEVTIPPAVVGLIRKLQPQGQSEIVSQMGKDVACRLGAFFMDASRSRHKVAKRFGVEPTGILEFTDTYPPVSRGGGEIKSRREGSTAVLRVTGVPFLNRAYGALQIQPRKAHCLTIPINKASVHHSASEMKTLGYVLFSRKSRRGGRASGILYGKRGGRVVPLFALVRNAIIPRDRGLMPTEARLASWAAASAKRQMGV